MKAAFLVAILIAGLGALAWGVLEVFAGSMSDNPGAGNDMGNQGCIFAVAGLVAVIGAIVWMVRG
jgi:hypothetical protein